MHKQYVGGSQLEEHFHMSCAEQVAYWVCAYANNQHELGNVPRLQRYFEEQTAHEDNRVI